jgi:hypothetical protein
MGTPNKIETIDEEKLKKLRTLLRLGNFREVAAESVGISSRTLRNWMKAAKGGDERYQQIAELVEQAEAESGVLLTNTIWVAAMGGHWQAAVWLLEHGPLKRFYGYKAQLDSDSDDPGEKVEVHVHLKEKPSAGT